MNITKEQAIRELWRRGSLSYKLRPEQQRLLDLLYGTPKDLAVFNLSRRLGKSTTCSTFCVENAIKKKQHIRYATAFLTDLEAFIVPIFDWVLEDCPQNFRPQWMASKKEYRFPNGSVIKLVGLDKNPNGIRGNAIDILVIDEAAFVNNLEYLYKSIIVPATMKRQFKLIFPSTPPISPDHFWSKELIPKAIKRNTYIEMTIDDISDLPKEERQRLLDEVGGEFSTTAQREFFCKIVTDENRAIAPEFKDRHIKEIELPKYFNSWIAADLGGVRDYTAVYLMIYLFEEAQTYVLAERSFPNTTPTNKIADGIKELEGLLPNKPNKKVIDGSGQTLTDLRTTYQVLCSLPEKTDFDASINLIRVAFAQDKLLIHPSCKELITTLKHGLLNKNRTDYERNDRGHCDEHAAIVYGYRHRIKENPFPRLLGKSKDTHHIFNETESQSKTKQTLSKAFTANFE